MDRLSLIEKLSSYFQTHAERGHIDMAFLYGSWATGKQRNDSDVDMAVLFSDDAGSDDAVYRTLVDISTDLGGVFGRETNVIRLQWDFDKPMLYYNAAIHGVPLYVKDKGLYVGFVIEALSQMEDFCIFGINWQLAAARRNLKGVTNA